MRDEVATYHGRATSCNRLQPGKRLCRNRAPSSELTWGGVAFYPRKVAVVVPRPTLRRSVQVSPSAGRSSNW